MIDLDRLTADQLRSLFARTPDATTRRAIQRRLQQLDSQPPAPPPELRKLPQMQESGFRNRFLANRAPTTRPWWSLAQITDALDRTTAEWHDERKKRG